MTSIEDKTKASSLIANLEQEEDEEHDSKEVVQQRYFLQEWKLVKSILNDIVSNGRVVDLSSVHKIRSISEDDLALKRKIEQCVENLQDADFTIRTVAICSMWLEIRTSTSSMISVSKPLKFLHPHYETMKSHYELMPESDLKKLLANILSVLAWTISAEADRESLKYRFLGSKDYIGSWGHEYVRQEIRTSTSSMTSVPKPLKFLRPHYGTLKSFYESMPESDLKKLLADILSVLALTMSADGEPESLKYRMLGSKGDIGSWGHEYVRNLAGEIAQDYAKRVNEEAKVDDLIELVEQIVAFHMKECWIRVEV